MKITTWLKYEESYTPPRCRKARYIEREEFVDITLREVAPEKLTLAYEDKSYQGKGKIFRYGGKLWAKSKMPNLPADELKRCNVATPLDWLVYHNRNYSTYFSSRTYFYGEHAGREAVLARAKSDAAKYILVGGELFERTAKPEYFILTFGCGNGDGTGLFVKYPARRDCGWRFPANKGAEAVAFAKKIAIGRGDVDSARLFSAYIICY